MQAAIFFLLMLILILCFALLLAWLAARDEVRPTMRMTLPPGQALEICNEDGSLSLVVMPDAPALIAPPAPADGADPG